MSTRLACYVYEAKGINHISIFEQYVADIAKDFGIAGDDGGRTVTSGEIEDSNRLFDIAIDPLACQFMRNKLILAHFEHIAAQNERFLAKILCRSLRPKERIFDQFLEEYISYYSILKSTNVFLPNSVQKKLERYIEENWTNKLSQIIRDKSIAMVERMDAYEKFFLDTKV